MRYIVVVLYLLQFWLTFQGKDYAGKYINPAILFLVSMAIPVIYLVQLLKQQKEGEGNSNKKWMVWLSVVLTAAISVWICIKFDGGFKYFIPIEASDVIPQLEALWDRFARGEQPYYPLTQFSWQPFPVYMPGHWLIIGIPKLLHIDLRWIGLVMLLVSIIFFVYHRNKYASIVNQLLTAVLPLLVLLAYYYWGGHDFFVTFEAPIAAYYLILAIGLNRKSLVLTMTGIILCMLSRYTLIFWLPMFALMLLHEKPLKQNIIAWSSVLVAFVIFYIIPFILRQPDILAQGVKYHNQAAVGEWSLETSWTFEFGIYFAPHFHDLFSGDMEHRVFLTRIVQGSLMILLNIAGYVGYRKWKNRISFYDYSLIMLYTILVFFYAFGPLTYRYYLITPLLLSAVICCNVINRRPVKERSL